jgi:hypothetical protein
VGRSALRFRRACAQQKIRGEIIVEPRRPDRVLRHGRGEAGAQGALGTCGGTARLDSNSPLRSAAQSSGTAPPAGGLRDGGGKAKWKWAVMLGFVADKSG